MKKKTWITGAGCIALAASLFLSACQAGQSAQMTGGAAESTAESEAPDGREDAAESEASAGDTAVKPELLVVSFGTSYPSSRNITIGGIENALREAFPDYDVVRAFTAQTIIDKLKDRDGIVTFNVEEALDDAVARGVKTLLVQPTHLMDGYEYMDLKDALSAYEDKFDAIALGEPLLNDEDDYGALVTALTERMSAYDDGETAICFMGHGTEADANEDYAILQQKFTDEGWQNYYVGTVEAEPTFTDVIDEVKAKGIYSKAVLVPLMVVAGDHATNDMAGDEDDSWKSLFEAEGFDVTCILEGLGQDYNVQSIYVSHAKAAAEQLAE